MICRVNMIARANLIATVKLVAVTVMLIAAVNLIATVKLIAMENLIAIKCIFIISVTSRSLWIQDFQNILGICKHEFYKFVCELGLLSFLHFIRKLRYLQSFLYKNTVTKENFTLFCASDIYWCIGFMMWLHCLSRQGCS